MDLGLKDKVVIVVGGAQWGNIPGVIDRTFAEEGAKVVVADIDEAAGQDAVTHLKAMGAEALFIKTDVTDMDNVMETLKRVKNEFGAIDVQVNTAAYFGELGKLFIDESPEGRKKETDIIFNGTINCIRAVLDYMIEQKKGSIVNVLSDAGRVAETFQVHYGATKAGVAGFTRGIAREIGRYNVRVNCVSPGMTQTEKHMQRRERQQKEMGMEKWEERQKRLLRVYPLGRLGDPRDIADAVVFLASDRAGWITGQTLSVNGGYAMAW